MAGRTGFCFGLLQIIQTIYVEIDKKQILIIFHR